MEKDSTSGSISLLLVEDSRTNVKIVRSFLAEGKTDSYDIIEAATIEQAKAALQKRTFELVLLDLNLPDSTGMDTVQTIRSCAPDIAIVAMTSHAETHTAKEARKYGCEDFLIKGKFEANILRHIIRYAVERNRMLIQLRESEKRFQDYAEAGVDWFWEMDADLYFQHISDEFREIMGLEKNVFLGKTLEMVDGIQKTSPQWDRFMKLMGAHKPVRNFEFAIGADQDDMLWMRVSGRPVINADGKFLGYRGTGSDITLEKYNDWQFRASKDLIDGILSTSLDGFIVLKAIRNANGGVADFSFAHINRRAEELLGRNRSDLLGKLFRLEMPHMVDRGVYERSVQTVGSGETFDLEQDYAAQGMSGWLRLVGVKLGDGVVITLSDINDRKEAEREQRLATALFRTSDDAMVVTDADNHIIAVNPSFTKITGFADAEVLGKDPKILSSGRHEEGFFKDFWSTLDQEGHWHGEIWNRRKDGEIYVQRTTVSQILNDKGMAENYVSFFREMTEEKEEQQKLYQQANYDALTNLPNRTLLADRLSHAIPAAKRQKKMLAVMFIDLDGFKPINDTHGHLAGDQVLQDVAQRFQNAIRESDTVARIGGDEFVVLCEGLEDRDGIKRAARELLECLDEPFDFNGVKLSMGGSIGISLFPEHGEHPQALFDKADKAMYDVKKAGKGDFRFYEE